MKHEDLKKFENNFYRYSTFYAGDDQEYTTLKQSWILKKIVGRRKSWNVNSLTRFIKSLPHHYDFYRGDFFKFCLLALKGSFIKSSFLQIQQNASIETWTGRETVNSSSSLCDYYISLRFEEIFEDMPLLYKLTGIHGIPFKGDYADWAKSAKDIGEKHRNFFLEDRDFLLSLICFFGMLKPEKKDYYHKIACLEDDDYLYPDIEKGREILMKNFFDGMKNKYINKVNKLIKKELMAISLLPLKKISDIYLGISLAEDEKFVSYDKYGCHTLEYLDICLRGYQKKSGFIKSDEGFWEIDIGDKITINNMVGAYKVIQNYSDYFSQTDLDFLLNKKLYLGEQSQITCIKNFDLKSEDMDKIYLPEDKNTEIFQKKLDSERLGYAD